MKLSLTALSASFVLLATAVFPSLSTQIYSASSLGVFLVSILYVFHFGVLALSPGRFPHVGVTTLLIFIVFGIVFIHGVANYMSHDQFDLARFIQSNLLLILYLLGAFSFCLQVARLKDAHADFAVQFVAYSILLSSVAGFFKYSPFSSTPKSPVFFYNEASHYAVGLAPFLLYMVVISGRKIRWLFIILAYLIGLSLPNFTLVLATTLVVLLVLSLNRLVVIMPIVVLVLFAAADNLDYFTSRATISEDNTNLSNLVYLSGWERAYLNLEDTYGLGSGLNQLGVFGRQGVIMDTLSELNAPDLNRLDGGSVAPKFIAEFGMPGFGLLLVYFYYSLKIFKWFRTLITGSNTIYDHKQIFFRSCFLMYSVDLFVRGAGYFSAEGFMFISSLIWMLCLINIEEGCSGL
jgi:hypothetical protein